MFAASGAIDGATVDLALVAADLGGHALERARLYAEEQQLREALDRVARLAPLFADAEPEDVPAAICHEARTTFDADAAQIWTVDGERARGARPRAGLRATSRRARASTPSDFIGLDRVLGHLETFFVPDAQPRPRRAVALELVQRAGIRSVLRVPIVIGGRAESMLGLMWHRVIPEPRPADARARAPLRRPRRPRARAGRAAARAGGGRAQRGAGAAPALHDRRARRGACRSTRSRRRRSTRRCGRCSAVERDARAAARRVARRCSRRPGGERATTRSTPTAAWHRRSRAARCSCRTPPRRCAARGSPCR